MKNDEIKVTQKLPWDWWLYPTFDFGLHYPCPYIWFAYWLITWGDTQWEDETWFVIGNKSIPKIHISFLSD
jgi:hypothetical protein